MLLDWQATVGNVTFGIGMTNVCAPVPVVICCGVGVVARSPIVKATMAVPSGPTPGF